MFIPIIIVIKVSGSELFVFWSVDIVFGRCWQTQRIFNIAMENTVVISQLFYNFWHNFFNRFSSITLTNMFCTFVVLVWCLICVQSPIIYYLTEMLTTPLILLSFNCKFIICFFKYVNVRITLSLHYIQWPNNATGTLHKHNCAKGMRQTIL